MAFKDILVALTSYPEPTPVSVVDDAVSVAVALGAHLAALSFEARVQVPGHFISNSLVAGMISAETEKSRNNARELLAAFDAAAETAGILHETILEKSITLEIPDLLVEYARLRDLTSIPPKNLPRIWPGTASMWCWTRSTPKVVRSAAFWNPIHCLIRRICS